MFDTNNKIVKLCAEGMEFEGRGNNAGALKLFQQAWEEAAGDVEKYIAAHYIARHQDSIAGKLKWDQTALHLALEINDDNTKAALPSLYLNVAKCYEDVNDLENASIHYASALTFSNALAGDGYGNMIKKGIENGLKRIADKMNLFPESIDATKNWLPKDGVVNYYGKVLPTNLADRYFEKLMNNIDWRNDEAVIFGRKIMTKRKVAWYAGEPFAYTYSNITKTALLWTSELLALKTIAETTTHETYNSCLLNLYHAGDEGMAWHSDGEKDLLKEGAIASFSFGAERKFAFKHKKTGDKISIVLEHGSLLVMKGTTQTHWLHRLPPTKLITSPRINLTFRTIIQ